jgi:hypothetical protein
MQCGPLCATLLNALRFEAFCFRALVVPVFALTAFR